MVMPVQCKFDHCTSYDLTNEGLPFKFTLVSRSPLSLEDVRSLESVGCIILDRILMEAQLGEPGATIEAIQKCVKCMEAIRFTFINPGMYD